VLVVGTAGFEPVTPCSQSQIGPVRHLRRRRTAQVEAGCQLSVVVRSGPFRTAVNGTLVARSHGATWHAARWRRWLHPDRRVRPVLGDHRLVGQSPDGSRQPVGDLTRPQAALSAEVGTVNEV
jgi:hypothetical protein